MKKKHFKLLASVASLALVVGVMGTGIWAATQQTFSVSSTAKFVATGFSGKISVEKVGSYGTATFKQGTAEDAGLAWGSIFDKDDVEIAVVGTSGSPQKIVDINAQLKNNESGSSTTLGAIALTFEDTGSGFLNAISKSEGSGVYWDTSAKVLKNSSGIITDYNALSDYDTITVKYTIEQSSGADFVFNPSSTTYSYPELVPADAGVDVGALVTYSYEDGNKITTEKKGYVTVTYFLVGTHNGGSIVGENDAGVGGPEITFEIKKFVATP